MGTLLIVTGSPAAGKTAFAQTLSKRLSIPLLCKDQMKIALYEYLAFENQAQSRQLSKATVNVMLSAAESLMQCRIPLIMEANFRQEEAEKIQALILQHSYKALTYLFEGDPRVLGKRFIDRDRTDERHPANRTFDVEQDLGKYEKLFREFSVFDAGGETAKVDATNFASIDYEALVAMAERILGK
ncbi:MAG: ATP-binding protein [Clostridiales bacterium]|jgi:predicted kinase|nr:ATP-binding protein [Clostridiales bacterium]